jgi:hypothetical protein
MNVTNFSIRENLNKLGSSTSTSLLPCRITKVNKDNLTVDVYIQDTSSIVYNVPICFPNKGKGYGSYFMPRENATCLIAYSSKSKPYILAYAPVSISLDGVNSNSEKLMPGENVVQSYGNAYVRQDIVGNAISSSQFGNTEIQDANGVNRSSSLGTQNNTIAKKNISGLSLTQNAYVDREALNSGSMKVFDYTEYYSEIEFAKVYKPDEIISYDETGANINLEVRQAILDSAKSAIDMINLFKTAILTQKSAIQNISLSDNDFATVIADAYLGLKNFNIIRKGVKIVLEKGNAVNKRPNNISDIIKMTSSDFAKRQDTDIAFRFTVEDASTGEIKARVTIDIDGNCDMKFKSLNVDAETFTTTSPLINL